MNDLADTIAPKSDQLNADDLIGGPRTIKITEVIIKDKTGNKETDSQRCSIRFEGDEGRPYKPGLSMRRALLHIWGKSGDGAFVGRSITLYCDPNITFGPAKVGGIRISHASHIEGQKTMALTVKRGAKATFTIKPLETPKPAAPDIGAIIAATALAHAAATGGTEAFRAWYNSDEGKGCRHLFKDDKAEMGKIMETCAEADEAGDDSGDGGDL